MLLPLSNSLLLWVLAVYMREKVIPYVSDTEIIIDGIKVFEYFSFIMYAVVVLYIRSERKKAIKFQRSKKKNPFLNEKDVLVNL